jgi:hypothetical protein
VPTTRALAGVAHDIAHYANSGVSYLLPHAFHAAHAAGRYELTWNLLADPLLDLPVDPPLTKASDALRKRFVEILASNGFEPSVLASAILLMQFPTSEPYYCVAHARLETRDGKVFEKSVSYAFA